MGSPNVRGSRGVIPYHVKHEVGGVVSCCIMAYNECGIHPNAPGLSSPHTAGGERLEETAQAETHWPTPSGAGQCGRWRRGESNSDPPPGHPPPPGRIRAKLPAPCPPLGTAGTHPNAPQRMVQPQWSHNPRREGSSDSRSTALGQNGQKDRTPVGCRRFRPQPGPAAGKRRRAHNRPGVHHSGPAANLHGRNGLGDAVAAVWLYGAASARVTWCERTGRFTRLRSCGTGDERRSLWC